MVGKRNWRVDVFIGPELAGLDRSDIEAMASAVYSPSGGKIKGNSPMTGSNRGYYTFEGLSRTRANAVAKEISEKEGLVAVIKYDRRRR